MALHLLLAVWLATVCALAQPQPPGTETIDVDLPPPDLPLPLIHFKLGDNRNIISSTKKKQSWNAFYTTTSSGTGTNGVEPATSSILVVSANGTTLPPYDTVYTFNQLIDHNNTKLGTFEQRYYFTYEFYEPGGPIFFALPSEASLDNYDGSVTNSSITGYLAQLNKGAAVVLEHRFFGKSNPYPDLSETSFKVHTIEQALADVVYFAQNVHLPMPNGTKVGPDKAPWVIIGGSYPGALVAWTMQQHPNIFAAGWASSAVVQAQDYFWSYFDIVKQFMPANCSNDIQAVITHLDTVFTSGSLADQAAAKATFALTNLQYADDVMATIRAPIFSWQELQPYYQDTQAGFYAFCNYLEYDRVKKQYESSGSGVGLQTALAAYGNWTQYETRVNGCTGSEELCYGTHTVSNSSRWTNTTIDNTHRSWAWLYCNQLGWYFSGAPPNWPTIASRLNSPDSEVRICSLYFPNTFPMGNTAAQAHNTTTFNAKYGGWNIQTTNVFYANGKKDVWRGVTLSSDMNNHASTPNMPIAVADGGFHCSDMVMQAGVYEPTVAAVQNLGSAWINKWLTQWYMLHPNVSRPVNVTILNDPTSYPTPTFTPEAIPTSISNGSWLAIKSLGPLEIPTSATASGDGSSATGSSDQSSSGPKKNSALSTAIISHGLRRLALISSFVAVSAPYVFSLG
ncbi:hypothetical protein FRC05_009206 [Tulasnella sp. 425]|nr:hypothetical protein FRC05_009206 [Tulasnella sp. 425]